ncbi:olfactory receptor 6N1-like [Erpetoichthys calabaricus]|uniref:olfactory receptor 6N1-like n=1 Tax=Erpetoichthys calabaricus TaxID=27687 RepID=UPI00109FE867|nr:olfactory receptor 6N1-like [Erpetoichthys calabaricus]
MANFTVQQFSIACLQGFQNQDSKIFLSVCFLIIYLFICLANITIIIIFALDENLHKPMYIMISNLAAIDIVYSTVTIPKMLAMFLFDYSLISFPACFLQMIFYLGLGTAEVFLLVLMAYDRYLAICNPLHYPSIMTNSKSVQQVIFCWVGGLLSPLISVILAIRLPFCGPNRVLHCFCDHSSVIRLACAEITINSYVGLTFALGVLVIPLAYILYSYVRIIMSVIKITSSEGRFKAFSTCGTHLIVVCIFFLSSVSVYISYRIPGSSEDVRMMTSIVGIVISPVINPIIYCLRTKEIWDSCMKTLKRAKLLPS